MPTPIHAFIDTNVFLSFFSYTNDDIEELRKLIALIESKRIKLYLTEHVCREFERNREKKMIEAIKQFKKINIPGLPRLMDHYDDSDSYNEASKTIRTLVNGFIVRVKKDAFDKNLPADNLFSDLKSASRLIVDDVDTTKRAKKRTELNEPPGKIGSLGDRLHWEDLLSNVPDETDLHIVSQDGDFASLIDEKQPHPVLSREWKENKKASLFLYTEIAIFLSRHFPEIKVSTDVKRRDAIEMFVRSGFFERTHTAVSRLTDYITLFTDEEIDELVEGGLTNNQISLIGTDEDIKSFFKKILGRRIESYSVIKQNNIHGVFGIKYSDYSEPSNASLDNDEPF